MQSTSTLTFFKKQTGSKYILRDLKWYIAYIYILYIINIIYICGTLQPIIAIYLYYVCAYFMPIKLVCG